MTKQNLIEMLELKELNFDTDNPRLPSSLHNKTDEEIIDWMLRDGSIIELMKAIGEQGFFPGEPLLVSPDKKNKNKLIVVEGNRRLCAVKLLNNPELATRRKNSIAEACESANEIPKKLPILKFIKREDILDYLGYRHITGIKEWDPLAKARYLKQLEDRTTIKNMEARHKTLAREIGSHSDYVARLLTGLSLYNKIEEKNFFDIDGFSESDVKFSLITTALNYTNIPLFLGIETATNPELTKKVIMKNLKEFTKWFFERDSEGNTRIGESRNIKYLNSILESSEALKAFRDGTPLKDAILLTKTPSEVFSVSIFESKNKIQTARDYVHLVKKQSETDVSNLEQIKSISDDLLTVVSKRRV